MPAAHMTTKAGHRRSHRPSLTSSRGGRAAVWGAEFGMFGCVLPTRTGVALGEGFRAGEDKPLVSTLCATMPVWLTGPVRLQGGAGEVQVDEVSRAQTNLHGGGGDVDAPVQSRLAPRLVRRESARRCPRARGCGSAWAPVG